MSINLKELLDDFDFEAYWEEVNEKAEKEAEEQIERQKAADIRNKTGEIFYSTGWTKEEREETEDSLGYWEFGSFYDDEDECVYCGYTFYHSCSCTLGQHLDKLRR